jgi:uroporphyrinogen-III decarboxylase
MRNPPRLPFWQEALADYPNDVCAIWELDRAEAGWFFGQSGTDDWGCRWQVTEIRNMGRVVEHPLREWSALDRFRPPDPRNPYYFERVEQLLGTAAGRYVVVTCHFNLIERFHMLRGFAAAMEDFYCNPKRVEQTLDIILEFKLELLDELARRCAREIDGIFLTDDWGTQQSTLVSGRTFDEFFARRYGKLFEAIHQHGWHVFLHSCGHINVFVPRLIELGVDVLNMQQPRNYGLKEFGETFRGKVCFLATADIQTTLPGGNEEEVRREVRDLVRYWGVPEGGLIAFHYGDEEVLAVDPSMTVAMFDEFVRQMHYWQQ